MMKTKRKNESKVSYTYNIFCMVSETTFWCGNVHFNHERRAAFAFQ